MTDAIIEPAAPPAEQFRQERQAIISRHIDEIAYAQQIMADNITGTKESKEFDKLRLETSKKALVNRYFSFPYLEKYIEWDFEAFAAPVLTADDISNIVEILNFRPSIEAIDIYIYSVFDKGFWDNLGSKYIDCPEKAEIPLSENELETFTFYLDNIFKPAFLDIIKAMRDNKYRSLEIIHKEQNAAFSNWYDNQKDKDLKEKYSNLSKELYKARNDFLELISKYSKANKFREKLANGSGKSPINIEKVFKTSSIEFPLDKVNKNIWGLSDRIPSDGSIITFGMESRADKRKGREVDLMYSIDFTALEESESVRITKKLTPFDKRVYTAIGALYNAGNTVISLSQIYTAMGNTGRPPKTTLDRINDSITKMLRAVIYISNEPEAKVYNYPHFVYDGNLLPIERISNVNINGKTTEVAIHILREPPMISFAKKHGNQLTAVPIKLLQSPISKTDNNLQIEEYLIERIAKAKKGSLPNKILMSSIYEGANITDTKQKQRLPEKLIRYLDHYKKENFIKGYSMSPNSVTIDI